MCSSDLGFEVGQTVNVKVLSVDPEKKRISLSIRQALEEEETIVPETPAEPEAEYEVVATDDTIAERMLETAEEAAETVEEKAAEAVDAVEEKAAEAVDAVAEAVEEKAAEVAETVETPAE